jgi:hypothetical protein
MLLNVTLFTHLSDGPFWRPIERNYCHTAWWTNLIYMNNFLLQDVEVVRNLDLFLQFLLPFSVYGLDMVFGK